MAWINQDVKLTVICIALVAGTSSVADADAEVCIIRLTTTCRNGVWRHTCARYRLKSRARSSRAVSPCAGSVDMNAVCCSDIEVCVVQSKPDCSKISRFLFPLILQTILLHLMIASASVGQSQACKNFRLLR